MFADERDLVEGGIARFELFQKHAADARTLAVCPHEKVMHIGGEDAVIHRRDKPDKLVSVPRREHGAVILQRLREQDGLLPRLPADGKKELFELLRRQIFFITIFDHGFLLTFGLSFGCSVRSSTLVNVMSPTHPAPAR